MSVGVHVTHCCLRHGCKYGDEDCPVAAGTHEQMYKCESCDWEEEEARHINIPHMVSLLSDQQKQELLALLTAEPVRKVDKIVRCCAAYFLSRSNATVYFKLHFSDHHVWDMPVAEWDAIPDA